MTISAPPAVIVGETFSQTHQFDPVAVSAFSMAMGDTNPLHHDAAFAARSRYKALIVSGTQTTALLLGLTASHFSKQDTVVGVDFSVKLRRPVFATDRVTLEWTVTKVEPHKGGPARMVELIGALRDSAGRTCVAATGRVLVGLEGASPDEDSPGGTL